MELLRASAALILLAGIAVPIGVGGIGEIVPGPVPAEVLAVLDGDTLVVRARIWLGQDVETRIRLDGIDAPELKGKCESERRMAVEARDRVARLAAGGRVILRNIQYGKYAGRVVARVETPDGRDFSDALLSAGLARAYDGRRREPWCGVAPASN
ncbi:MAG: thermonuclease family protein [Rhodospirillales bacterium]